MKKKILYIDMDNVLVDFQSGIDRLSLQFQTEFENRLDEVPGIFGLMKPIPGAIEAYKQLSLKFDTYILSTAPWENPLAWNDKLIWVKKNLGDISNKRLILSHHKNLLRGDFLVDDRPNNGAAEFEGKWIHFGNDEFPNWKAVEKYLERLDK